MIDFIVQGSAFSYGILTDSGRRSAYRKEEKYFCKLFWSIKNEVPKVVENSGEGREDRVSFEFLVRSATKFL